MNKGDEAILFFLVSQIFMDITKEHVSCLLKKTNDIHACIPTVQMKTCKTEASQKM